MVSASRRGYQPLCRCAALAEIKCVTTSTHLLVKGTVKYIAAGSKVGAAVRTVPLKLSPNNGSVRIVYVHHSFLPGDTAHRRCMCGQIECLNRFSDPDRGNPAIESHLYVSVPHRCRTESSVYLSEVNQDGGPNRRTDEESSVREEVGNTRGNRDLGNFRFEISVCRRRHAAQHVSGKIGQHFPWTNDVANT